MKGGHSISRSLPRSTLYEHLNQIDTYYHQSYDIHCHRTLGESNFLIIRPSNNKTNISSSLTTINKQYWNALQCTTPRLKEHAVQRPSGHFQTLVNNRYVAILIIFPFPLTVPEDGRPSLLIQFSTVFFNLKNSCTNKPQVDVQLLVLNPQSSQVMELFL